jgi:hypothetical protein
VEVAGELLTEQLGHPVTEGSEARNEATDTVKEVAGVPRIEIEGCRRTGGLGRAFDPGTGRHSPGPFRGRLEGRNFGKLIVRVSG